MIMIEKSLFKVARCKQTKDSGQRLLGDCWYNTRAVANTEPNLKVVHGYLVILL